MSEPQGVAAARASWWCMVCNERWPFTQTDVTKTSRPLSVDAATVPAPDAGHIA